jgi:hypothetical protein
LVFEAALTFPLLVKDLDLVAFLFFVVAIALMIFEALGVG